MDDIGLGNAIANSVYLVLVIVGVVGTWIFLKRKVVFGAVFWLSSILNLVLYLYFMGRYAFYPKTMYLFINKYWPWINLILFILLVISFIKNKYAKAKNNK